MKGKVKWYNVKQGYGFIKGEDGEDVFVHKNEIPFWSIFLKQGEMVEYDKEIGIKGSRATKLKLL